MAMAVKSALGDPGYAIWDSWSQASTSYRARDAQAVWRSVSEFGGISDRTLWGEAKQYGWSGEAALDRLAPIRGRTRARERGAAGWVDKEREARADGARMNAMYSIEQATLASHPYLVRKGHPDALGLVLQNDLLVPMRNAATGDLVGVQRITRDGGKKFTPGCRARGAVYRLGRHAVTWLCEGYVTGLSVARALRSVYRDDAIMVAFSASNMARVKSYATYVVADHDLTTCFRRDCGHKWDGGIATECPQCGGKRVTVAAGEKHARETGLPWWMPPEPQTDANDFELAYGTPELATALLKLLKSPVDKRGAA